MTVHHKERRHVHYSLLFAVGVMLLFLIIYGLALRQQTPTKAVTCSTGCLAYGVRPPFTLCGELSAFCATRIGCRTVDEELCREFYASHYGYDNATVAAACAQVLPSCSPQPTCLVQQQACG